MVSGIEHIAYMRSRLSHQVTKLIPFFVELPYVGYMPVGGMSNQFYRSWYAITAKKPVTTMLTYPWKCTVLHCNHLGNTWKPLVLMT